MKFAAIIGIIPSSDRCPLPGCFSFIIGADSGNAVLGRLAETMAGLLILAPLRIEARALRRGLQSAVSRGRPAGGEARAAEVVRTGMGADKATRAGERTTVLAAGGSVAVAGFCGGLRAGIRTGDVIVASEVRGPRGVISLVSAPAVAETLRAAGLTVHVGPILASREVAFGGRRARAAVDGALGVDMESFWLIESHAAQAPGAVAVVRAVSDTAGERILGGMLPFGWLRAYRSLVRAAAALEVWAGDC